MAFIWVEVIFLVTPVFSEMLSAPNNIACITDDFPDELGPEKRFRLDRRNSAEPTDLKLLTSSVVIIRILC